MLKRIPPRVYCTLCASVWFPGREERRGEGYGGGSLVCGGGLGLVTDQGCTSYVTLSALCTRTHTPTHAHATPPPTHNSSLYNDSFTKRNDLSCKLGPGAGGRVRGVFVMLCWKNPFERIVLLQLLIKMCSPKYYSESIIKTDTIFEDYFLPNTHSPNTKHSVTGASPNTVDNTIQLLYNLEQLYW